MLKFMCGIYGTLAELEVVGREGIDAYLSGQTKVACRLAGLQVVLHIPCFTQVHYIPKATAYEADP